ncbi:MAG: DEAD/DEAH box helicase, partial [Gammaproteobacteria bacterium]|nr:DEAD/DEAH box helicase [Gammaproteobacteria bacterium]
MQPTLLSEEISNGLKSFITTGFETDTPYFKGLFSRFVEGQGNLLKGPWVSMGLPFQTGEQGTGFFSSFETTYPPYVHQQQAWERITSDRLARSTLVATGTGSGKTECFLYPLLDHCGRHREKGIKAIVIYPMNALATDQAKRFAEEVAHAPSLKGVRVGLFVGGKEEQPVREMQASSVITDKNILRETPPDILLTNYKMLDFLLLRPKDRPLWRFNGPETLRYLVVDELHTFDGAQGTDLACLIRRLRGRVADSDHPLICV